MRRADLPPDRGGRAVVSEGASKRLSVGRHGLCVAVQHGLLGLGGGPLAGAPALLRLPRTRAEILVSGCRVNGRRSRSWPPRSQGARLDAATRAGQSRTDLWQSAPPVGGSSQIRGFRPPGRLGSFAACAVSGGRARRGRGNDNDGAACGQDVGDAERGCERSCDGRPGRGQRLVAQGVVGRHAREFFWRYLLLQRGGPADGEHLQACAGQE